MSSNTVWVAEVTTESCDHYTWVYANEPTHKQVIRELWNTEDRVESLKWYMDTTGVRISEQEIK